MKNLHYREVFSRLNGMNVLVSPSPFSKLLKGFGFQPWNRIKNDLESSKEYNENVYKTSAMFFKMFAGKIDMNTIESNQRSLQTTKKEIIQCFNTILNSEGVKFPVLKEQELLNLSLHPEIGDLQAYLLTKKFEDENHVNSSVLSNAYLQTVAFGFAHYSNLINYASMFKTWNVKNDQIISELIPKMLAIQGDEIFLINVLPFLLRNMEKTSVDKILPLVSMMIKKLKARKNDKPVDLKMMISDWVGFIENVDNWPAMSILFDILCHFKNSEDRSRAMLMFLSMTNNFENEHVLKDLVSIFKSEFGNDTFTNVVFSEQKEQFKEYLSKYPIALRIFTSAATEDWTLSGECKNNIQFLQLFDFECSFYFNNWQKSISEFKLVNKMYIKTAICKALYGYTFGEYMIMKQADIMIRPTEFFTNSSFESFSKDNFENEFENKLNYIKKVKETTLGIKDVGQENIAVRRQIHSNFMKRSLFNQSLKKSLINTTERNFSSEKKVLQENSSESPIFHKKLVSNISSSLNTDKTIEKLLENEQIPEVLEKELREYISDLNFKNSLKMNVFTSFFNCAELNLPSNINSNIGTETLGSAMKIANSVFFEHIPVNNDKLILDQQIRMGKLHMNLNLYTINENIDCEIQSAEFVKYLSMLETTGGKTHLFVLMNNYFRRFNQPNQAIEQKIYKVCLARKWPMTLLEFLYLQMKNNFLTKDSLILGVQTLSKFAYINEEAVDLTMNYYLQNLTFDLNFEILQNVFESMIVHGQVSELFIMFEELKNQLSRRRYVEDSKLDVKSNEELEAKMKLDIEEIKINLYSVIFGVAVKYGIQNKASMIYSEMFQQKYFKNSNDIMNMIRFSKKSRTNLDNSVDYIFKELKYLENNQLFCSIDFADELLTILKEGGTAMGRYTSVFFSILFSFGKIKFEEKWLIMILKAVHVSQNFNSLDTILQRVAKMNNRFRSSLTLQSKEQCLKICSLCNDEGIRRSIVKSIDAIFNKDLTSRDKEGLGLVQSLKEERKMDPKFKEIWDSRLEKSEKKFLIHTSKVHPKKRTNKDKRGLLEVTLKDLYDKEFEKSFETLSPEIKELYKSHFQHAKPKTNE